MSNIQVGNAPCSWGTLEFEGFQGERIGYQQMLNELTETGYTGTELGDWGFMPTEPDVLRLELSRRGLTMLGAFIPVSFRHSEAHRDGELRALQVARLLCAVSAGDPSAPRPFLVLADENGADSVRAQSAGRITSDLGLSRSEWDVFTRGVTEVSRTVRAETGLPAVFHHHCGGYVETPDEISRLLELTDPDLVGLVFDTGHYAYGSGQNDAQAVIDGLERFAERIRYVHLKDCQPAVAASARTAGLSYLEAVRSGVFCELGNGLVPFPDVVSWLRRHDYRGWALVEQDVLPGMGTPKESARRNRDYLRSIGL
ncbi:MAG TPA: TIM barrel protein [Chloroflexota bacterium]|nr:TIM barrel protein [Chloroflexota bacterium]